MVGRDYFGTDFEVGILKSGIAQTVAEGIKRAVDARHIAVRSRILAAVNL